MLTERSASHRVIPCLLALSFGLIIGFPSATLALRPVLRASFLGIETGRSPAGVATADLDGSGVLDLVVTNRGSNTLTLLVGTGSGRFDARSSYAVGAEPRGVALADLAGDGWLDALVANHGSNDVTVLRGAGAGFDPAGTNHACGPRPWGLVAADFDADGHPDVAVANFATPGTVSILLGNGAGRLGAPVAYGTAEFPGPLAVADLDGDGDADLVAASFGYWTEHWFPGGTSVTVLLGNGDGTFSPGVDYTVGSRPAGVAVGDLNGDGRPEIVTAGSWVDSVSMLRNLGDGTFAPATSLPLDYTSPAAVALADLNGDQDLDLVVAESGFSRVFAFPGQGDGSFGPAQRSQTGGDPVSIVPGDFDGDGDTDLAAACGADVVAVMRGHGDGRFGSALPSSDFLSPRDVACADFDGDGKLDLVASGGTQMYETGQIFVQRGFGDGRFGPTTRFGNAGTLPVSIALADFDHDGRIDVGTSDYGNGSPNSNSVFRNTGGGGFSTRWALRGKSFGWSCAAGDLNADGFPDLAVTTTLGEVVQIYPGSASGVGTTAVEVPCPGWNAMGICVGDLNGDGRLDMAVSHWGPSKVSVLLANEDGSFTVQVIPMEDAAFKIACEDLDADGKLDLAVLVARPQDDRFEGTIQILIGQGDGQFSLGDAFDVGPGPQDLTVADANADGIPDLVTANADANTVTLLLGNGDGSFPEREDWGAGSYAHAVTVADVNRDRRPDLVVANTRGNDVSVLLNETPLAVEISDFAAAWTEEGVQITWTSHTDADAVFRVLRADAEGGPWAAVSPNLAGSPGRQLHQYTDRTAPAERDLYYKVAADEQGLYFETRPSSVAARGLVTSFVALAPNPALGAAARVDYALARAGGVRLEVFDLRGRRVRVLVSDTQPAGRRAATWDGLDDGGRPLPSGAYFVRLRTAGQEWSRKLVWLRR